MTGGAVGEGETYRPTDGRTTGTETGVRTETCQTFK